MHTDIPTWREIEQLAGAKAPGSVSIYVPTSPISSPDEAARIEFKNLSTDAVAQLRRGGAAKSDADAVEALLAELFADEIFWRYLSHSLAVFATPDAITTYRLPNHLRTAVEVSDRFYLKPLLRTATFPQSAFVLALAQNSVRLVDITPSEPAETIAVPDLPKDVASAVGHQPASGRLSTRRVQGSEGQKVRLTQYARAVDRALRPVLTGHDFPLILAATEPLAGIYRQVSSSRQLAAATIEGNPEETSDADLADAARRILDELYAQQLAEVKESFETRLANGSASAELEAIARAATFGAVETLVLDIDQYLPGVLDEQSGAITATVEAPDSTDYGIVDEIARRTLVTGGRVVAVRAADVPGGGAAAATLRFAV